MPCYHPLTAYRARHKNPSGKRGLVFNAKDGYRDMPVQIACGQCVGCRLERSRQWAIRCMHEAQLHKQNCFITLTYEDKYLPEDWSLDKTHFQKFMKRYRKRYPEYKIRYFHCGEYGEKNNRPHYHACIFGHDFQDKQIFRTKNNIPLFVSDSLSALWPYGFSTIGNVTFDSAAYVARYIMKKVNINENTPEHLRKTYERVNAKTGEVFNVLPEYTTMSRGHGIGKKWYEKYKDQIYPDDYIIVKGRKVQPPKYYDELWHNIGEIKKFRRHRAATKRADNTTERLEVKEKCKLQQIKSLNRELDEDSTWN